MPVSHQTTAATILLMKDLVSSFLLSRARSNFGTMEQRGQDHRLQNPDSERQVEFHSHGANCGPRHCRRRFSCGRVCSRAVVHANMASQKFDCISDHVVTVSRPPTSTHLCQEGQSHRVRPAFALPCSSLRFCSVFSQLCSCRKPRCSVLSQCFCRVAHSVSPKANAGPSMFFSKIDRGMSW